MTASTVKSGLDEISGIIRDQRGVLDKIKTMATNASAALAEIPTDYASELAEIDAYPGGDAFEDVAQAEKAKMTAEFAALKSALDGIAGA